MDAGDRWMLNDAAGKPMLAWDNREHLFRTDYDELHRPTGSFVKGADQLDPNRVIQFGKIIYGDTPGNGLTDAQKTQLNLRGKPYQHYDTAGIVVSKGRNPATDADEAFDFKGNPLRSTHQLVKDYKNTPDWSQNAAVEDEIFSSSTLYDALNRPIQLVAPHCDQADARLNVIRPGYNEANLLERVDVWLEQVAEPSELLNPVTAKLHAIANIDYDAKGQRIRVEYNEATHPVITEYTYDPETLRLTRLLTTRPAHLETHRRRLQDLAYTYDPVGNITGIRDDAQQTVFFDNSTVEPSNTYVYDALYRLIRAEGREHAAQNNTQRDAARFEPVIGVPSPNSPEALQRYREEFEYDPVGNIMRLSHAGGAVQRWMRRYQYALNSNRLLATRLPGDPDKLPDYTATPGYSAKYTYDVHGNMTAMPHLQVMEWDFKDQLRAAQQQVNSVGTGEKTWYVYDASGQRVRKLTERQNGKPKEDRIYLGAFEVYRKYNGNGQKLMLERESLHVMDDKRLIALVETRTRLQGTDLAPQQLVRFQLGNHLGSAALELDDHAQLISYEEYHPYGSTAYEAASSQTGTPKRYRYTGKERDEESGLYYYGARYCAAWLGRWTNCDPIGIRDGNNVYCYVRNNPIVNSDPAGSQTAKSDPNNEWAQDVKRLVGEAQKGPSLELVNGKFIPFYRAKETVIDVFEASGGTISNADAKRHAEGMGHFELGDLIQFAKGLVNGPASWVNEKAFDVDPNYAGAAEAGKELGKNLVMEALTAGVGKLFDLLRPAEVMTETAAEAEKIAKASDAGARAPVAPLPNQSTAGSAALNDPAFNSNAMTVGEANTTLKAIRRHTDRLATGKVVSSEASVRDLAAEAQSARATGNRALASSARHELMFSFSRELEGRNLLTNRRLDTPGQISDYRVPDFQLVDPSYSPPRPIAVWDLKVRNLNEYSHWGSNQFSDIRKATGIRAVPLYFKLPPIEIP
jgi:RHS repeat-associated protein